MTASPEPLFDPAFLSRLEYLALAAKRIVRGELRGERPTQVRGSGVQFADFREYQPGDDFRYVDWHAYARIGQLLLKLFEEEQDLHVYFLLDHSRSMGQGAPSKSWFAKRLTAALAFIALSNLDRAGVSLFHHSVVRELSMARGKDRILSMLSFLKESGDGEGSTDLAQTVKEFLNRNRRQGVVVLISDLFDDRGYRDALDCLRYARHQVMIMHVIAEKDRNPSLRGDVDLEDAETGVRRAIIISERSLAAYRKSFDRFLEGVNAYGQKHEVPILQVQTDQDLEKVVLELFRRGGFVQ